MRLEASYVSFRQMRWLEIYLKIKIRNIRQKKYVAVQNPKLHKIDWVNLFLQCVFFPKKIKNQKFWNRKLIQFKTKLAESGLLVIGKIWNFELLRDTAQRSS